MKLGKVGPLRFREITQTPPVQKRIGLVRRVLGEPGGDTLVYHRALIAAQEIAQAVTAEDRSKMGVYLCSGGDVSTFIAATGCHAFLCIDQHPFFGDKIDHPGEKTPEAIIREAAQEKQAMGYWHNLTTCFLDEIGVFMVFEILGLGGNDLKIFSSDDAANIYRIQFNLTSGRYEVHFVRREINAYAMPDVMDGLPLGVVMLKAGDLKKTEHGYELLTNTASRLPVNTLIITDKSINRLYLKPVPFSLGEGLETKPFGYELGGAYLYRVQT